jgi:hypothetical protein
VARRVQPQKRGTGGKFVKAEPVPSSTGDVDDDVPTIDYDPPSSSTATRTAKPRQKAKNPSGGRKRSSTAPPPSSDPPPAPRGGAKSAKPLGFLDGLLGPVGLRARG